MIFRYAAPADHSAGGFSFHLNEATINTLRRARTYNSRGRRRSTVVTLHVRGKLKEVVYGTTPLTTQDEVTTAIAHMENNFLLDLTAGSVTGLYLDDGVTPTAHGLTSADALNGVQVLQISYERAGGAEYTNLRSFDIVLRAEYMQTGAGGDIQFYRDTIRTLGTGGPLHAYRPTWGSGVKKDLVFPATPQHIYQTGMSTSFSGAPPIPLPLYANDEVEGDRFIDNISPENRVLGAVNYTSRWSYHMTRIASVSPPTPGSA